MKIIEKMLFIFIFAIFTISENVFCTVEVGLGKMRIGGLMQFWYENNLTTPSTHTFRIRRCEIRLTGDITPKISYSVMFDPASVREDDVRREKVSDKNVITSVGRKSILQDLTLTFKPHKRLTVNMGQFKVPYGMEGLHSSSRLDFVERSFLSTQARWADFRDTGITFSSDFRIKDIRYQPTIGIFNGDGQNRLNTDSKPLNLITRLVVKPIDNLHLGMSYCDRKLTSTKKDADVWGLEAKYIEGPFSVSSEYAGGKDILDGKTIKRNTYYIASTYKQSRKLQFAARYDIYEPDKSKKDDKIKDITLGANYFIEGHNSKIQANYTIRKEEGKKIENDIFRVNFQISY